MSDVSPEHKAAAERRAAATPDARVEALLWERKGYVVRGLADRVAAVDASLEAIGYAPEAAVAPAPETAAAPKPRARKATPDE